MSNDLKKIVKKIQFKTDKTIEEIAKDIGYARAYFTNQINVGTNKNLKELLEKYLLEYEQNVLPETQEPPPSQVHEDPAIYNTVLPLGDLVVTLKDYVDLLKEKSRMAEESKKEAEKRERTLLALLENNLTEIKANSITIKDRLAQVGRMVRADDLEMMDSLDRIEGREVGTSSTEAGIVEHGLGALNEDIGTNDSKGTTGSSGKEKRQRKA